MPKLEEEWFELRLLLLIRLLHLYDFFLEQNSSIAIGVCSSSQTTIWCSNCFLGASSVKFSLLASFPLPSSFLGVELDPSSSSIPRNLYSLHSNAKFLAHPQSLRWGIAHLVCWAEHPLLLGEPSLQRAKKRKGGLRFSHCNFWFKSL